MEGVLGRSDIRRTNTPPETHVHTQGIRHDWSDTNNIRAPPAQHRRVARDTSQSLRWEWRACKKWDSTLMRPIHDNSQQKERLARHGVNEVRKNLYTRCSFMLCFSGSVPLACR